MAYTTHTLADLVVRMTQRWDGSVFWTQEDARTAVNEALREWNLLTGRWRATDTLSTQAPNAGVPVVAYDLSSSLTFGMRVKRNNSPLHPTSVLELDLMRPTWRFETTASGGSVPTVPTLWAPQSLQTIVIWPATATTGTNDLLVDGVANTPILSYVAGTVDLADELLDTIVDFAVHIAAFKEAGPRWVATRPAWAAFLRAAAEENSLLKAHQLFRRLAGLDRRRDLQPTHKVSTQLDGLAQLPGAAGAFNG